METRGAEDGLRVLILEDTESDAELVKHELHKAGIRFLSMTVDRRAAFASALRDFRPEIIISDYHLVDFNGLDALMIVGRDHPEVPVIMVTGALGDMDAVELIHAGAKDYVLKDRLARLAPAVLRVLANEQVVRERRRSEQELEQVNRALRTLSACNHALVRAASESDLLHEVCHLIVEIGGYSMVWVGWPVQGAAKSVFVAAQYGDETGYLEAAHIEWSDGDLGRGPSGTALRTGAIQVNQDLLGNPDMAPWREAALARGYRSNIAVPLKSGETTFGVITIYGTHTNAFVDMEVDLLVELAEDLAYGITARRTQGERDRIVLEQFHHVEVLRHSLEESVKAIANTLEMRDPYTAGHQRRVGLLAVAIARQMGLPEETIHGLGIAASIHDLGKIGVPAEILSKPGRLSPLEFMLLKNHAQAGFDILKDIKFPWPIATIVLQHHERMDGTGYPHGLKGEATLPESRILAVTDVFEAMSSHRPYRAALGVEAALAEIERGCGTSYDAGVVAACLYLFREKGYTIPA